MQQLTAALAEARQTAAQSAASLLSLRQDYDQLLADHQRLRQGEEESLRLIDAGRGEVHELQRQYRELQAQFDALREQLLGLQDERRRLQEAHDEAQRRIEELSAAPPPSSANAAAVAGPPLEEWQAERETLIVRLADTESKLSQVDPQKIEDLQSRFELAVNDLRELKLRKAEMEEELASLRSGNSRPARAVESLVADGPDWESTKRRMLESLQADGDAAGGTDDEGSADRLTIESTIQITDDIVAQKDQELAELRLLLSQQSSNLGSMAVGAAAVADVLGQDELIQQEREKLRKLQEEWRDKLRHAEIDISVERARMARQRAEIEEKVSAYESQRGKNASDGDPGASNDGNKKPVRGRWLSRLGLKDEGSK